MKTSIKCTDLQYLNKITKSDSKLILEMISLYLEQTPALIDTMKSSLLAEDWNVLKATAHKLIPSFSIIGLQPEYEELAIKIQGYTNNRQNSAEVSELLNRLEIICNQACVELKDEYELISLKLGNEPGNMSNHNK